MTSPAVRPDRGLDTLNLLLSAAGSAYGTFIPVYLASRAWTQTEIGLVLTISVVTAMLCLLPAGMLIDAFAARRRRVLAIALVFGAVAPVILAAMPRPPAVMLAVILQAAAASVFTPAIAAISLGIAGPDHLSERLGRNARYGSIGAGLGAAIIGICCFWGGERAVFIFATAFTLLALAALARIGPDGDSGAAAPAQDAPASWMESRRLLRDRRVLVFCACVALFQIGSIAVVQLAAVEATQRLGGRAGLVIAMFVIVPQVVVAWLAPIIGRFADNHGRKRVLLAGFLTVPVRDTLFAVFHHAYARVPIQALEGAGGATFGIMLPLIAADLTRRGGFFTSCMGLFGLASNLGSAISTSLAGWIADRFGHPTTYAVLALVGVVACVILVLFMAETRPGHLPAEARKSAASAGHG